MNFWLYLVGALLIIAGVVGVVEFIRLLIMDYKHSSSRALSNSNVRGQTTENSSGINPETHNNKEDKNK